jgi:hypothetical protein
MSMGKYQPLGDFLRTQRTQRVPMTFDEIERITGVKLPPKAQHQRAWWSNNPSNNVMTKVWLEAGFESEQVDMAARRLVFRRVHEPGPAQPTPPSAAPAGTAGGRHPLFGALKGLVRVPPGIDLTEPADPEWADRLEADDRRFDTIR